MDLRDSFLTCWGVQKPSGIKSGDGKVDPKTSYEISRFGPPHIELSYQLKNMINTIKQIDNLRNIRRNLRQL